MLTSIGTTTYIASYDADVRLSSLSVSNTSAVLFQSQRGYDAVGNVTAVGAILAADTDNHMFCYDDQHRLTWAGSAGTPNCGTSLTPGSLTAANYTQTFTYDTVDRIQSGPLGAYSYGDSAHLHAVTSIANGDTTAYSATYDAGGNMACRAATSSTTCSGTPTGTVLRYDNEGRLAAWQNTPTSPTSSDSFLYDGEGNRVEQQTTTNGSIIASTVYVAGGLEEITSTGSTSTLTKYFGAQGLPTAERAGTNGPLSYLATDGQGTVSETLDGSGNVTSAQLYTPYGNVRYSSGSSPTSMGYTGQRADSATGLDYYHARYYDPVAGQFVSADTMQDGLNRYGYVRGNPTTATDPSGHRRMCDHDCWAPSPPKHKTPPPEDCRATHTCKGDGGGKKGDGEDECQRTNTCSSQSSGDSAIKQECVSICRAQEIAGDESGFFSTLGFHLTLAAIAIEASGALLDVIGAFFPLAAPVTVSIGVFVGAIGGIIGVLAADAYWLSSKFSWNSGWSVASGRWDSRSALEAMRQEINDTLNTEIAVLGGLGGKSALEVVTDAAQWILDQNGIVPFIPPWGRIVASDVLANAAYLWMSLDIMLDANMAIDSEESALGV